MNPRQARALATLLRTHREQLGLTAREVARRSGVDVGTVTRMERQQIPYPRPDSLVAIGDTLGIPAADLFAVADWLPKHQLPAFQPYLRAKYDLSDEAAEQVEAFLDRLRDKHGADGPNDGEDER